MPRQGNRFAAIIGRSGELRPWLTESEGRIVVNTTALLRDYDRTKYKRNPQ
jgi:hypothetical protein